MKTGYSFDKLATEFENHVHIPKLATFVYTGGLLTQMTETLYDGVHITTYTYSQGRIVQSVETFRNTHSRTITYNYAPDGTLTGFTTVEV